MSQPKQKWIVKNGDGRIYGPFSTEKVLQHIEDGYFAGEELVALYPGGEWIPISRDPIFYDKLLDALASEKAGTNPEFADVNVPEDIGPSAAGSISAEITKRGRLIPEDDDKEEFSMHRLNTVHSEKGKAEPTSAPTTLDNVIELADVGALVKEEKFKSARFLIIGAVILLILYFVLSSHEKATDRIHLLGPRPGKPMLSDGKIKEKMAKAKASFQLDTYRGYLMAQNELVELVEGSQRPLTAALGLLCLTYRELWPFSFQDSADLATIKSVAQEARKWEPVGANGVMCEVVHLMTSGRYKESRALVDSFHSSSDEVVPALVEIKSEMLWAARDLNAAAQYYKTAREVWPNWLKPYVQEARVLIDQRQYREAINLLRMVLKANPHHSVARVELGILEAEKFKHYDQGYDLIRAGLDTQDKMSRTIESRGYLALARIHLQKNEKRKALDFARKAYASNPSNNEARRLVISLDGVESLKTTKVEDRELLYLGDQYIKAGNYFAAQAEYKAAFEHDPKNGTAAMKAAKALWQLNQSSEAIAWLLRAIQADPKLTAAYVALADYYSQRFDYLAAIQALQKIQKIDPKNYEVYRGFALVELRRNNANGAVTFAQRALQLYGSDGETYTVLGEAYLALENYSEAFRSAKGAVDLDDKNVDAQTLFARVKASFEGVDSGIDYLNEKINTYPNIVEYRVAKGEILVREERLAEAEDEFRKVIALEASNKKAFLALGAVLSRQPGRARDALEIFLRAAALDPSDANPLFLTGKLYLQEKNWSEAINQFQRVIKINERFPLAHYYIGRAALDMGDPKLALTESELERNNNPDLADAYILAAEAYYQMKQYPNCAAEYQRAVQKRPQGSDIYIKMAACYRLSGALDSAASLIRQASALESGNPEIYKEKGAIYQTTGQTEEALEAYQTYLRLMPNAPDQAEIQLQINKLMNFQ